MSFLSLRFRPARQAWKNFTTKLQSKLRKLQRSKAITKHPRNRLNPTNPGDFRASGFLKELRRKKRFKPRFQFRYVVKRKPAPIYMDQLLTSASSGLLLEAAIASKETKTQSSLIMNNSDHGYQPSALPETSQQIEREETVPGDIMWESVGLASPLMHRIDERAEDFIARFRAEMKYQERQARDL